MATLITPEFFQRYQELIQVDMFDTFYQDKVVRRVQVGLDRWKEDNLPLAFEDTELKGLYSYNYFRQWQITVDTITGTLDKATEAIIFSRKYLEDIKYINPDGSTIFNLGEDEFYVRGVWYKMVGFTDISQAPDKPLLHMIVLQRQEYLSGKPKPFSKLTGILKQEPKEGVYLTDSSIRKRITYKVENTLEINLATNTSTEPQ